MVRLSGTNPLNVMARKYRQFCRSYRRVLFPFLAFMLIAYCSSVFVAYVYDGKPSGATGDALAALVCLLGVVTLCSPRVQPWQHAVALACLVIAPLITAVTHDQLAALPWSLIPLIMVSMYIRGVCPTVSTARGLCLTIAALAVAALALSPAEAPFLWFLLWPACIIATAEIFGSLAGSLLDAVLRDPLTSVWNRAGAAHAASDLIKQAEIHDEEVTVIILDVNELDMAEVSGGTSARRQRLIDLIDAWRALLPSSAVLARLAGKEFIAIVRGARSQTHLLAHPLTTGHAVPVSFGIATGPAEPDALTGLLLQADSDLYRRRAAHR
ncbi:diguanylate cyclase domain-containing protein [Rhodococcus sovatensis]|uniref:Diguanylate cyclase n=1 Tax=Rhodococcus sovatensis TaxID=1805840 RepID=A0ABZ2PU34_9NOCA